VQSGRLVPLGQGEQGLECLGACGDVGPGVAALLHEVGHGAERQIVGHHPLDLVPEEGRRHLAAGARPGEPGAEHGLVRRVLVEVHEDAGAALLLPPVGGDQVGMAALELAGERHGGGPHLDLLRRLSHWLMKQPELEEEALRLKVQGRTITVERQTMSDSVSAVTLTAPTGAARTLTLHPDGPGIWNSSVEANELGLWRATDGKLTALTNVGPANPREFQEVTSTTDVLRKLAQATGGEARRLDEGRGLTMPRVVPVRTATAFQGDDWIGLKMRDTSVVRGIGVLPVFSGLLGLLLLIGSLAATWAREGR